MQKITFRSIRFRFLIALVCIALLGQGIVVRPALAKEADAPNYLSPVVAAYQKPVSVSWSSPQKAFVFVIATDGTVWERAMNGNLTWDGWVWLAAPPVSGRKFTHLAAASWATGRLDLFGVDDRKNVWHKYAVSNGSSVAWYPQGTWEDVGGPGLDNVGAVRVLQVVSWGANRLDIFMSCNYANFSDGHSVNYSIWQKWWDGYNGGWSGWNNVTVWDGDPLQEYVSTWGPGRLDRITGLTTYPFKVGHKYWDGSSWQPPTWEDLGGEMEAVFSYQRPYSVSWGPDRLDVFSPPYTTGGGISWKAWTGSGWTGWTPLGGNKTNFTGVSWGPSRIDLFSPFTQSGVSGVYHRYYDGSNWYPTGNWEYLGGESGLYISVTSMGYNRLDIFGVRSDSSLWHLSWDGSAWRPSINGWELINP